MTPLLEARGVSVRYGATVALDGLDAAFAAGRICAVLGENGSGKSTLLKLLARIVRPDSGDLWLEGAPLSARPRRETARRIAYVPQSADLVFPIASLDLVLQGRAPHARSFSADSPEDRRVALAAMQDCDVAHLASRDASALSGGEQRRVLLARALAQDAEIWLLDEPTANLDPRHRLEFLGLLTRIHARRGTTVLLVTHEMDLAAELSGDVLLLRRGRTIASGPSAEILTPERIRQAFDVEARVEISAGGRPRIVALAPALPEADSARSKV
jgi:iron complex transport system ATP-binding protein